MRYRDTQICFRAVEDLSPSEKVWAYQVSGLFCEDHAFKFRFHYISIVIMEIWRKGWMRLTGTHKLPKKIIQTI